MPRGLTEKQIERALIKCGGFSSAVAKKLKVTVRAIDDRIAKSEHLKRVKHDICESKLDFTESQLMKNVKQGKEASIFFHLKCKGKQRGYIEKQEVEHSTPKDNSWSVEIVHKKMEDDD